MRANQVKSVILSRVGGRIKKRTEMRLEGTRVRGSLGFSR
jgi:hypothetical protein